MRQTDDEQIDKLVGEMIAPRCTSIRVRRRSRGSSCASARFARWDVPAHDWVVDDGPYELVVAASVVDERFRMGHEIGVHA